MVSCRRRPALIFRLDQWVWLATKDFLLWVESKKLAPRYMGPFKILRRINLVAYQLMLPHTMKINPMFLVLYLKSPGDPSSTTPTLHHALSKALLWELYIEKGIKSFLEKINIS